MLCYSNMEVYFVWRQKSCDDNTPLLWKLGDCITTVPFLTNLFKFVHLNTMP